MKYLLLLLVLLVALSGQASAAPTPAYVQCFWWEDSLAIWLALGDYQIDEVMVGLQFSETVRPRHLWEENGMFLPIIRDTSYGYIHWGAIRVSPWPATGVIALFNANFYSLANDSYPVTLETEGPWRAYVMAGGIMVPLQLRGNCTIGPWEYWQGPK